MSNLLLLLATLYVRTPAHRNSVEIPLKHTKRIVDSICEEIKVTNQHEFEYSKTDLVISELKLIETVMECLNNKYYQLYVAIDSKFDVVTSDNPFMLSHPNAGRGFIFGLNTSNIEICVPLTRKTFLIARNEPFEEGTFRADDKSIGLANHKQITNANRFFFSSKPIIALVDDDNHS
jgi:hypothetical protein